MMFPVTCRPPIGIRLGCLLLVPALLLGGRVEAQDGARLPIHQQASEDRAPQGRLTGALRALPGWSAAQPQEPAASRTLPPPATDLFTQGQFREVGENGFVPGNNTPNAALGPAGQAIQAVPFRLKNFLSTGDGSALSEFPIDDSAAVPFSAQNPQGFPPAEPGHEIVIENYPDGQPKILRSVTQDEAGNYLNDGPWQVRNQRGQVVAEGTYRMGIMHGQWGRRHFAGEGGMFATAPFTSYQGPFDSIATFRDGKLDGAWVIYDPLRRSILEVNYRDGRRHGPATWFYPDRTKYREAVFQDGVLDGDVVQWDPQQQEVSRQSYREGRRVVRNTTFYRGQEKKSEAFFLGPRMEPDGLDNWWDAKPAPYESSGESTQDGPVQAWYPNRQLQHRGQYRQGQPVGVFAWWHENGNRQSLGEFDEAGQRTGRWIWWHPNGLKQFEGFYDAGQPVGTWQAWDAAGNLTKTRDFPNPEPAAAGDPATSDESIQGTPPDGPPALNREDLPLPAEGGLPPKGTGNEGAQLEGILPLEQASPEESPAGESRQPGQSGEPAEAGAADSKPGAAESEAGAAQAAGDTVDVPPGEPTTLLELQDPDEVEVPAGNSEFSGGDADTLP